MTNEDLLLLLEEVHAHAVSPDAALARLQAGPFRRSNLGFAEVDHHRRLRHGMAETIYGESKTTDQIVAIATELSINNTPVLITRLDEPKLGQLSSQFPAGRINTAARTFLLNPPPLVQINADARYVAIVAAGTSDIPVAEEACEVCLAMRTPYVAIYDVGVAGLHRLLRRQDELLRASALVVVAGMEGALPSVVAGLVAKPIFAVPTSVGYGASFGGIAALLAMLNSCAPGVAVVNIDNGYSAAFAACQVIRLFTGKRLPSE